MYLSKPALLTKLLPEAYGAKAIYYYHRNGDYRKGYYIILYFFDTEILDSMIFMHHFIKLALMQPDNYYAFVTEYSRTSDISCIKTVPGVFNFNVIYDQWYLTRFFSCYEIPVVIVFNSLGQLIAQIHPSSSQTRAALSKHQLNVAEGAYDAVYDECIRDPTNVIHFLLLSQLKAEDRYISRLGRIHNIVKEHPEINKRNDLIIQGENNIYQIPYLTRRCTVYPLEKRINMDPLLQDTYLRHSQWSFDSFSSQAYVRYMEVMRQKRYNNLDYLFNVYKIKKAREGNKPRVYIPADPSFINEKRPLDLTFSSEPKLGRILVYGTIRTGGKHWYEFNSDWSEYDTQISGYKYQSVYVATYDPRRRTRKY